VLDARRPFHLDNVFNEESIKLVCQESELNDLNLPEASEIYNEEDDESNSEDEGDEQENRMVSVTERLERRLLKRKRVKAWQQNREQIIWKYNHKSYISFPVSSQTLLLFDI
jgi:hypothetical protein